MKRNKYILFIQSYLILIIIFLLAIELRLFSQEGLKEQERIDYLYALSFDELMNVRIEVASLTEEDELMAASSVTSIKSVDWKRYGARRTHEALVNGLNVVSLPTMGGSNILSIRGYTTDSSVRGVSWMIDNVPVNTLSFGTAAHTAANWDLGALDAIEMIKGPGSAIYGSDAFHGVVSLKTFESDMDHYSAEIAGASSKYYDGSIKLSQGFAEDLLRIDLAASVSGQGDQDIEYEWEDAQYNTEGTGIYRNIYKSQSSVLKLSITPADKIKIKFCGYVSRWDTEDFSSIRKYVFANRGKDLLACKTMFYMGKCSAYYEMLHDINIEASGSFWKSKRRQELQANELLSAALNVSEGLNIQDDIRSNGSLIIRQKDNPINLHWFLGFEFTYNKITDTQLQMKSIATGEWINVPGSSIPGKAEYDGVSRKVKGTFMQLKWGVSEDFLYLVAGGRYDNYSDFGDQYTPRGGIILLPMDKSAIKALYGRAFRAPVGNELTSVGTLILGSSDMKPEILDVYELIYIYKGDHWKINLNGFYSYWKDGIIRMLNPDWGGGAADPFSEKYANEGKNRAYGGEVRLFYSIRSIGFDAGFAYTRSESLEVEDPLNTNEIVDLRHDAFPEYTWLLGIYYMYEPYGINFFINNRLYYGMKEFPAAARGSVTGSASDADLREAKELSLYWRMDLNINTSINDNMEITLDIRNLLNRENYMPAVYGQKNGMEEPGISVLLRASYVL